MTTASSISRRSKRLMLALMERTGTLVWSFRLYERIQALKSTRQATEDGALPLPPAYLRVRIGRSPHADWFLESGRRAIVALGEALGAVPASLEDFGTILDFGCGVGRVLRWLETHPGAIYGTDVDATAVEWCRRNLPFAQVSHHDLRPPTQFQPGFFDLVYSFSVFTHLPLDLQHQWLKELVRVIRPGGYLVISTHGRRYLDRLTRAERQAFERGDVVVRRPKVAGTNLCSTFHPESYVTGELARGLDLVTMIPEGARGNPHQDLYLFRV